MRALLVAALLLLPACAADVEPSGAELYARHCAPCHGVEGHGDGPVASSLRTPPSDLTTIVQRRDGFDERWVLRVIDGRHHVEAHGPREMPVWGAVFGEELRGEPYAHYTTLLHAKALTEYVRSLQQ